MRRARRPAFTIRSSPLPRRTKRRRLSSAACLWRPSPRPCRKPASPIPRPPRPCSIPSVSPVIHVQSGHAAAVVTNPIAKALLYRAGFKHPGHTEFLAELAADGGPAPRPVMMLSGGGLRVALATIHTPLAQVPGLLSIGLIADVGRIVHGALKRDFGIPSATHRPVRRQPPCRGGWRDRPRGNRGRQSRCCADA